MGGKQQEHPSSSPFMKQFPCNLDSHQQEQECRHQNVDEYLYVYFHAVFLRNAQVLLCSDIQSQAVYPIHDLFTGTAAIQPVPGKPVCPVRQFFQIGSGRTHAAAAGSTKRHYRFPGKLIAFHKSADNPWRISPPDRICWCQVRTKIFSK